MWSSMLLCACFTSGLCQFVGDFLAYSACAFATRSAVDASIEGGANTSLPLSPLRPTDVDIAPEVDFFTFQGSASKFETIEMLPCRLT